MTRNSTRARRICFDAHKITTAEGKIRLPCHVCKRELDPVLDDWRADHIRRHAEGGRTLPTTSFRSVCRATR